MSEIKIPATGRIVNYFPLGTESDLGNHPEKMAAIVADGVDLAPDLAVFTRWEDRPVVTRLSVQHKSFAFGPDGQHSPYWDWPEIK